MGQENVTYRGDHFQVEGSTVVPKPHGAELGRHPRLYFGGASPEAEAVAAHRARPRRRRRRGPRIGDQLLPRLRASLSPA